MLVGTVPIALHGGRAYAVPVRILIAIDRSEYAEIVIEHGLDQAVRTDARELHFLTAVESAKESGLAAAHAWLEAATREPIEAFGCGDRNISLHTVRGRVVSVIAELTAELEPDLLVIGRFGVPSNADIILEVVRAPTLVVGVEGTVLDPQCEECRQVREESEGERLFCERHTGDYAPDLAMRLPSSTSLGSRLW
ncbi:hypothetical protein BH11MYX3_BH11MYX3_14770 [soil metagenome]